jgi:hypothetical protein
LIELFISHVNFKQYNKSFRLSSQTGCSSSNEQSFVMPWLVSVTMRINFHCLGVSNPADQQTHPIALRFAYLLEFTILDALAFTTLERFYCHFVPGLTSHRETSVFQCDPIE